MNNRDFSNPQTCDPFEPVGSSRTTSVLALSLAGRAYADRADGIEGDRLALPRVQWTLPIGELVHRALIRKAAKGRRIDCPELTGQNRFGQPLSGPHRHVHILPVDIDQDGHLDHVILHASMGLSRLVMEAIYSLRTIMDHRGQAWLQVHVTGDSIMQQFTSRYLTTSKSGGAWAWTSLSPFVPPRFLKRTGKNSLEGQVQTELASRGLPEASIRVQPLPTSRFGRYILTRGVDHSPPPQNRGYSLQLHFNEPVYGPIALGYACHFGLGVFQAIG